METFIIIGSLGIVGATLYPILKQLPFAYGVTRIRASKGALFSQHELRAMATDPFKEIVYKLERRGYRELLDAASDDFDEEKIQFILRNKELELLQKLSAIAPKKYKLFFDKLIQKYDIENTLTLLRSKINPYYQQHELDKIIVNSPFFPSSVHHQLCNMNLHEFLDFLSKTPFQPIIKRFESDINKRSLTTLEIELTNQFFNQLLLASKKDKRLFHYTQLLIDIHNIKQALNFATHEAVAGGSLPEKLLHKLAQSNDLSSVKKVLSSTNYQMNDVENVRDAERTLLVKQVHFAKKLRGHSQFSIAPFLTHFIEQSLQYKNIRIILNLSAAGFDPRFIEGAII